MGGASRLQGGNQAKKANCFKVSVFDSHIGPKSAKTDSFFVSSAHIHFFKAGTGIEQCGAPMFFSLISERLLKC